MQVIAIDTSVFIGDNYPFSSPKYKRLLDLAAAGHIRVLVPDIVINEVRAHIRDEVEKACTSLASTAAKAKILRNLSPLFDQVFVVQDRQTLAGKLESKFDAFLRAPGVEVIPCGTANLQCVLDDYFAIKPPFENKPDKKFEFPDALILSVLSSLTTREKSEITLVTADSGWEAFAKLNSNFNIQKSVQAAIEDTLRKVDNADFVLQIEGLLDAHLGAVSSAITDHLKERYGYDLIDREGEVTEVRDLEIDNLTFSVIDFDKEAHTAVVSLSGVLRFKADVKYGNPDNATWDSEDRQLIYWNDVNTTIEEETDLEVELEFYLGEEDTTLDIQEIEIDKPKNSLSVYADKPDYS